MHLKRLHGPKIELCFSNSTKKVYIQGSLLTLNLCGIYPTVHYQTVQNFNFCQVLSEISIRTKLCLKFSSMPEIIPVFIQSLQQLATFRVT